MKTYRKIVARLPLSCVTLVLLLAGWQDLKGDPFTNTGGLTWPRAGHTATLLRNGKVLVSGGYDGVNWLSGAELYDPVTGSWTSTGSLLNSRSVHTATLLPNGQVLVAGGNTTDYTPIVSAELYDPDTGTWTETGALNTPRAYHTATLLSDGRVLVAGGGDDPNTNTLSSAELYDPVTGTWTMVGALTIARAYHSATFLPSGTVLVAGGGEDTDANNTFSGAELFDPVNGSWMPTASLTVARESNTATLLPNANVLVAGGFSSTVGALSSTELYNPSTRKWSLTTPMATARDGLTATLLLSGKVLVAGGTADESIFLSSSEIYDPATPNWTTAGAMVQARGVHTATLLPSGKVLLAGGYDGTNWLSSAELFSSPTENHPAITLARGTRLPSGTFQFRFIYIPGMSLSAFGTTNLSVPFGSWTRLGDVSEISSGVFQFTDPQATNSLKMFYRVASP